MIAVGVKELKNRLTHFLRLIELGEHIVITRREEPVAEIRSVRASRQTAEDAHLLSLAKEGLISLPTERPLEPFSPHTLEGAPASSAVIEDRR